MSSHDPKVTLQQIIDYANRAEELCREKSITEIRADWRLAFALERVMEVLGEAVRRLPPEIFNRYPSVNWKAILGMRNRVSHGYDSIDYEVLWNAARDQVPALILTAKEILRDLGKRIIFLGISYEI
ncbi:MAG: HepT-like ribonuclease domain-containing protein [Verrucomicrobiota bacterium]